MGDVPMPLIPPDDVDALASQLRAFLSDPKPFLRRAAELQKHVAQEFSVESMTREVVDFYDRRYNIQLTEQEKQDLSNFLSLL